MTEPALEHYLDLVALGTVADVVPLDALNRLFVTKGLALIRSGRGNRGISSLFRVSGRTQAKALSSDLGFAIGPRINAAGRLDDISVGIRCLLADRAEDAHSLAEDLQHINQARRDIQAGMVDESKQLIERLQEQQGELPWGICCYRSDWHQGVVGLVASKLKETLYRPSIAFAKADTDDEDADELKGSARSIDGLHIRDLLDRIASQETALIQKFGGHAMAAGLSIRASDYERFATLFDQAVRENLDEKDLDRTLWSDGALVASDLTLDLAEELSGLLPWGQQLPAPQFHGTFEIHSSRWLKEVHLKCSVSLVGESTCYDAIWFNAEPVGDIAPGAVLSLLYRVEVNEFRGNENLQLMVVDQL